VIVNLLIERFEMSVYYYFLTSVGIFPRKEKKLKKKIEVWSNTNPGGRKTKNLSCKSTALKRWMTAEMR